MTSGVLYMDAVITPNRSLSRTGVYVLFGIFGAANLGVGAFLLAIGATPVPIFLGLDFAALALAFHISNRRAETLAERVRVSADVVEVSREASGKTRTIWSSPTAFTQVSFDPDERRGPHLRLRRAGRALILARNLGPDERRAFAAALRAAIGEACRERYAP